MAEVNLSNLSEMALRILAELEEAGFENIPSTLNTVIDVTGAEQERTNMRTALKELAMSGLVLIAYEQTPPFPLRSDTLDGSLALIDRLDELLIFDAAEGLWSCDWSQPIAYMQLTKAGWTGAHNILTERGYQWWRQ